MHDKTLNPLAEASGSIVFEVVKDGSYYKGGNQIGFKGVQKRWDSFRNAMRIEMGAETYRNKVVIADDFVLYNLRHTYCTDLMRANVPINVAKYLMGHTDIRMITRIYGHQTDDQTDSAGEALNEYHRKKYEKNA